MDNLFLSAMDTNQQMEIQEIKANKEFARRLINDLDKVFQTNYEIEDDKDSVSIYMRTSSSHSQYGAFKFFINKNGIKFVSKNLGYYSGTQFKNLGELYEKYKGNGTKADENFLNENTTRHGWVSFNIPINRNGDNLNETLKDIMYIMEQNGYRKRF